MANEPSCHAKSLADVADSIVAGSPPFEAFWSFLACFCHFEPDRRQAMLDPESTLTGQPRWDAYLAAAAEHLANGGCITCRIGWTLHLDSSLETGSRPGQAQHCTKFTGLNRLHPLGAGEFGLSASRCCGRACRTLMALF
jgi:hypothetical protein